MGVPRKPSLGLSSSGSAISAFTPHTTVVEPNLTSADPSAVDIEPFYASRPSTSSYPPSENAFRQAYEPTFGKTSLHSSKSRPSGLTLSARNLSRYVLGCKRWNVRAFSASCSVAGPEREDDAAAAIAEIEVSLEADARGQQTSKRSGGK